jgi:hypothetical protein
MVSSQINNSNQSNSYGHQMSDRMTREYWRARAEETRTLAENMKDPYTRETMQRIARDYEMLAQRAEERERPS